MKGVILAGGTGTRLWPVTAGVSKQLLPVYDKPMIYYPLCTLMSADVRDVMVITTPDDAPSFYRLLGDGSKFGISVSYGRQMHPRGIAEALLISEEFVSGGSVALALGDNLVHDRGEVSEGLIFHESGATVFAYEVSDPSQYGVVDTSVSPVMIVEKPIVPPSRLAVVGVYAYDSTAADRAAELRPSPRGELEITDLNNSYAREGRLSWTRISRGSAWLDTGTFSDMQAAGEYVRVIEERQGYKVGCPEEVAWRRRWISDDDLLRQAELMERSGYGTYLRGLLEEGR